MKLFIQAPYLWILGWVLIAFAAIMCILINVAWYLSIWISIAILGILAIIVGAIIESNNL